MRKFSVEFSCCSYLKVLVEADLENEAKEKGWAAVRRGDFEVVANYDGHDGGPIECDGAFELDDAEAA